MVNKKIMRWRLHFPLDEVQSPFDGALSFHLVLFQQYGPHELVYGLIFSQLFKFLFDWLDRCHWPA